MSISEKIKLRENDCPCGRPHLNPIKEIICKSGAINELPLAALSLGAKKAFVLADKNTFAAAGELAIKLLLGASSA